MQSGSFGIIFLWQAVEKGVYSHELQLVETNARNK